MVLPYTVTYPRTVITYPFGLESEGINLHGAVQLFKLLHKFGIVSAWVIGHTGNLLVIKYAMRERSV